MSLPNPSDSIPSDSRSKRPLDQVCLECGRTLNPASGQNVCADCAMRNLLNLSIQQTVGHIPLPLFSYPQKDLTFDSAGSPHLIDPLKPEEQVGPFKIIRRLGRGGMGTVYEAQDCVNQRRVALKVLSRPVTNDEARQRFLREGRMAASINHPNSVFVFGTHQIDTLSMISMELVRGGTLESHLRRQGPLDPREAVEITLQLIDGLVAAHEKGILHRDIKPSNCFMGEDGIVKIGDFGLSISSDPEFHERITTQGVMLGTPAFSSPEQLRGDALDVRSDIYALGSTLYCLLTGKPPFSADGVVQMIAKVLEGVVIEPHQLNRDIPVDLSLIVMRCLSKEPGDRVRSYHELRAALLPLGATTVEPASLGLRALAEVIEWFAFVVLGFATWLITTFSALPFFYSKFALSAVSAETMLLCIGTYCLYYAATESLFGCSLGKWILQLRVVDQNQNRPSFLSSLMRAAIFLLVPTISNWLYMLYFHFRFGELQFIDSVSVVDLAIGWSARIAYWVLIAMLFAGARRKNGWLGIHEKISGTRVVQWCEPQAKHVSLAVDQEHQLALEQAIGPYSIIGQMATTDGSSLLIGFDPVLLRRVWIRCDNSKGGFKAYPEIARATRIRWLNCIEDQYRNWDVFEYVEGQPLITAVGDDTDWNSARRWLADLRNELSLATEQDTLPQSLSMDNLWLTQDGRLKLLDFPAPIPKDQFILSAPSARQAIHSHNLDPSAETKSEADRADVLLLSVAQLLKRALQAKHQRDLPPPLFVTQLLDRLAGDDDLSTKLDALKTAVLKPQGSERRRRRLMSAACYAIPILLTLAGFFSEISTVLHYQRNEGLRQIDMLYNIAFNNVRSNKALYSDAKSVLAYKMNRLVDDNPIHQQRKANMTNAWNPNPELRDDLTLAFEAPAPSQAEVEAAFERIKADPSYKHWANFHSIRWFNGPVGGPVTVGPTTLLLFVAIPAVLAGLLFRGGLIVHGFRTVIVTMNGHPAGRIRILLRNILPLGSILAVCFLWLYTPSVATISALVFLYGLAIASNLFGLRTLADRVVGTAVVSRD